MKTQTCWCYQHGGSRPSRQSESFIRFFPPVLPRPAGTAAEFDNFQSFLVAELLPALLTGDTNEFVRLCTLAAAFSPMVHVDVTDASVVPHPTLTIDQIQSLDLPLPIELHLMVSDADAAVSGITSSMITRVLFHPHASKNTAATLLSIREDDREAGIVLDARHQSFDVTSVINLCSQLTVLSVQPGYQGSPLDASMLERARQYRETFPQCPVEIDGGIKMENATEVASTRAQRYAVGSGIWKSPDPKTAYAQLLQHLSL